MTGQNLTCGHCQLSLGNVKSYINHLKEFHDKDEFELDCPHCRKIIGGKRKLYVHLKTCKSTKKIQFLCKNCKVIITSDSFVVHFKSHLVKQEYFSCPFDDCKFSFGPSPNISRTLTAYKEHTKNEHQHETLKFVEPIR